MRLLRTVDFPWQYVVLGEGSCRVHTRAATGMKSAAIDAPWTKAFCGPVPARQRNTHYLERDLRGMPRLSPASWQIGHPRGWRIYHTIPFGTVENQAL